MFSFLDVIAFYVWNIPQVSWILSKRIAGIPAGMRAFEMLLAGILLRRSHRIEIEDVIPGLREPEDRLIAAGETIRTMQPVFEMPNDAVAQEKPESCEDWVKKSVKRNDSAVLDIISDLPANTAARCEYPCTVFDDLGLLLKVSLQP